MSKYIADSLTTIGMTFWLHSTSIVGCIVMCFQRSDEDLQSRQKHSAIACDHSAWYLLKIKMSSCVVSLCLVQYIILHRT